MLRYGIQDYQPQWLNGRSNIAAAHARRLAGLVGLTLQHVWLVWDLDDDEWFTDAPVGAFAANNSPPRRFGPEETATIAVDRRTCLRTASWKPRSSTIGPNQHST
ncbi:hypothetical protein [Micromonospora sp. WMMC250]|uniref:hypothetical protein n=1 Tax=Micromonospora sp. WMMC250 TaxID=3014781 RepID=UPI0022B6A8D1|nr:hypothetical protein [Micromonospora sp. WMMC250]MCZ7373582.1 hypothetical protein [Micromonospora sp. WMMC250]